METLKPYTPLHEESEHDKKLRLLEQTVERDRPIPMIDFLGKRYYTREYILRANEELAEKISREGGETEESAHLAEWEFTYALGHEETLPGCRASLASEYDDHINGVDIVCNLTDRQGDKHVFGIDVSTATLPQKVLQKFERGDHPRGQVPSGCSFVKFYKDGDYVACLKGVPRFVLGASPLFNGHQKYLGNFQVNEEGLVSHSPDLDLRFNILSSLFLQSTALRNNLIANPDGEEQTRQRAIDTCSAVRSASISGIARITHFKGEADFFDKFNKELSRVGNLRVNGYPDECYRSVLSESIRRYKK